MNLVTWIYVYFQAEHMNQKMSKIDPDKIKNIMNVNFIGVIDCVKTIEDFFKNKKSGHISIVSSIAGYRVT